MKYFKENWSKEKFLDYIDAHSETPRALFNKEMVAEICELNGESELGKDIFNGIQKWYSIDLRDYVKEIRKKREKLLH